MGLHAIARARNRDVKLKHAPRWLVEVREGKETLDAA